MDFTRNGDRSRYQDMVFPRREDLFNLTVAECIEGEGGYIDDIINIVWLICEESTWVIPAHNRQPDGKAQELADIEAPVIIDLFSAETGSALSWTYYFLGDVITPLVKRRIEIEIERRILKPYLERSDFGWMGLSHDEPVNNWNPWINSNVLVAYLLFADKDTRLKGVEKAIKSTDRFMAFYAEDGGCDEGPGYFNVAGATLLDFLEELYAATDNSIDLHSREIIKNMARYIYRVYIGQSYYVNFADAHARVFASADLLYRTGQRIKDENLMGFACYLKENGYTKEQYPNKSWCLYRLLANIFQKQEDSPKFEAPRAFWFEGIQVLTARDEEGSFDGMFFSAKGGNNAESHNHNDIGNFILYCGSQPVIIDAGVETYSKKTFSQARYSIWTMRSCYHNTPTINGFDQLPGLGYKASSVDYAQQGDVTTLRMDIHEAYPKEAGIKGYNRAFTFKHGKSLEIQDSYALESCTKPVAVNFLAYNEPIVEKGQVLFGNSVIMSYDEAMFDVEVEKIALTDGQLLEDWQKGELYRYVLTQKVPANEGSFVFEFRLG
jgi:hypothetical protein